MNEIQYPGIRKTADEKYCFFLNINNQAYSEGEYYDAESAARAQDMTKFVLLQSGHMQRVNFYHFPAEVAKWATVDTPQPCSLLLAFMKLNPPRYLPFAQRQVAEEQKKKRALSASLPAPMRLFAAHQTLSKLLSATPNRLTDAQRSACQTVLELLAVLRDE